MNVPNQAITVGCNETFKQIWRNYNLEHNFMTYFGFASLSGLISSFLTMPMDTIKTRLNTQCDIKLVPEIKKFIEHQADTSSNIMKSLKRVKSYDVMGNDLICECTSDRGCVKYGGPVSTAKLIYLAEGLGGFYKGFIPRAST